MSTQLTAEPQRSSTVTEPGGFSDWLDRHRSAIAAIISLTIGFVAWEIVAQYIVRDKLFLVAPSAIVVRFIELWRTGEIQNHMWVSGQEFFLGFIAAALVGVLFGLIMGTSASVRSALTPWVSAIYATPLVALSPLLILWFGLGLISKVVVVFAVSVFPVLVNTQTGIESVDERLLETARAFGATRRQLFTKVLLPGSVPFSVAGLRLGIGRGLVGVVVGELFGARAGIGYLITVSSQIFDMGALFASAMILAIAGVLSTEAIRVVERKVAPWRWV
jgi:NitT/TauT family transport system permease protein